MVYLAKGKYAFWDEGLAIDFCKIYSRLVEIDLGLETRYFNSKVDVKRVEERDVKEVLKSLKRKIQI